MQSRYPYKPSETNLPPVSWLLEKLSDKNASDDGLFLISIVKVNEQILEVILTLDNNAILMACQINACYKLIILLHMMAHSTISIRLALCKFSTN